MSVFHESALEKKQSARVYSIQLINVRYGSIL